jgi:hypothetical protein
MDDDEPQRIDIVCLCCGSFWRAYCHSGRVDKRIELFALLHKECWVKPLP